MQRFIIPFRFAFALILPGLVGPGLALEMASGFGADATPAERQLAAHPEPDGFFRELTGFWHGVPGLPALRARWEGFAAEDKGFAVLAALVSEAEGQPEEALDKLRSLPGSSARWNEGRLLALLGRETDAVTVLSAVVREAERPEVAANALLALTELDCIRGDFAGALERTTAAWEMRAEDNFRRQILERHLSLLVEAGKEREFVDRQAALAAEGGAEPARRMAQRVMVVMADWFTADPRLKEQREAMAPTYRTFAGNYYSSGRGREVQDGGLLIPHGAEVLRLAALPAATPAQLMNAAYQLGAGGSLPSELEETPWLHQALTEHPFGASCGLLFFRQNAMEPVMPLAGKVVEAVEPGPVRRALDLTVRAWEGLASPADAATLAAIVVEAPETRCRRSGIPVSPLSKGAPGWPMVEFFPTEEVIWNLQGKTWTDYYRMSCRWAALQDSNADAPRLQTVGSPVWPEWRPDWPVEGVEQLMGWAWQQLVLLGEATPERAAAIAGKMTDPGDRVLFASLCGRTELLIQWCREKSFLAKVRTASLMRAAHAFHSPTLGEPRTQAESETIMTLVGEIARRMEVDPLDLVRLVAEYRSAAPPAMLEQIAQRPVDSVLAGALGMRSDDPAVLEAWRAALPFTVPHPLFGLPVCPSVERFHMITLFLNVPQNQEHFQWRDSRQSVLGLLLGGENQSNYDERPVELEQALAAFSTTHPLKHQLKRWAELHTECGFPEDLRRAYHDPLEKSWQFRAARVLRLLAEEEQAFLPWHLVAATLEENPAKRQLRLEVLRHRSSLSEGVFLPPAAALPLLPPLSPEPVAPGGKSPTPEQVAGHFLKLIADPAGRSGLEPAGNITAFYNKGQANAFLSAARRLSRPDLLRTAEYLLDAADPLAARMAVVLAIRTKPEDALSWLLRTLAVFPDDPELLLAYSTTPTNHDDPTAGAAFPRAFQKLTSLGSLADDMDPWMCCGVDQQGELQGDAAVQAIAGFVAKINPPAIPRQWLEGMRSTLTTPEGVAGLTNVRSVALAVARYQDVWSPGMGNSSGCTVLLGVLVKSGHGAEASEMAEALLSKPGGSLAYPGQMSEPAVPWNNNQSSLNVTGPKAEGWTWLQLAGLPGPAALADRLGAVATAHPGDEQIAFAALLARGLAQPAGMLDLTCLDSLTPAGRHRAVAYASWLLPLKRLPAAALTAAWEAEAAVDFRHVAFGCRNYLQGILYLDRLEAAGAVEAVRRSLPSLLEGTKKIGELPPGYPALVLARLRRLGTPEQVTKLLAILDQRLRALPETAFSWPELAANLEGLAGEDPPLEPSPELIRRVTKAFQQTTAAAASPADPAKSQNLLRLAGAAAGDPRWHDLLRGLLAKHGSSLIVAGENDLGWSRLRALMAVLASNRQIPAVKLELEPAGTGQGTLHWSFEGLHPLLPKVSLRYQTEAGPARPPLLWPTLAKPLDGKFEALLFVEPAGRDGEQVMAHWDRLPATGSLALTDLPPAGRLRLELIRQESPRISHAGTSYGYNTLPVIMDTAHAPTGVASDPAEWHLLTDPEALSKPGIRWHIRYHGAPDTALPAGLALLLLDASGQVGAGTPLSWNEGYQSAEFAGFPGSLVGAERLSPAFRPQGTVQEGTLTVTGPPTHFALAVPAIPARGDDPEPPARLTVQEWPDADPFPAVGSLEVLRLWQRRAPAATDPRQEYPPALRDSPKQAAWYSGGRLTVLDFEKNDPPRVLDLPLAPALPLQRMFWQGGLLHLLLYDSGSAPPASLLLSLDPWLPSPWPAPHRFDGDVSPVASYPNGVPDVTLFLKESEIRAVLAGAHLLLPPATSPPLRYQYPISPTRIACQKVEDGTYPVLDWTDGSLQLTAINELPSPVSFPAPEPPQMPGNGTVIFRNGTRQSAWRCPLQLNALQQAGPGLWLGTTVAGSTSSIVLLREVLETAAPPSK